MKLKHLFACLCLLLLMVEAAQATIIKSYTRGTIIEGNFIGGLFGDSPLFGKQFEMTLELDIAATVNTLTGNFVHADGAAPGKITVTINNITQAFSFQTTNEAGRIDAILSRQPGTYDAMNMSLLSADRTVSAFTAMTAMSSVFGAAGPDLTAYYEHQFNRGDSEGMEFAISNNQYYGYVDGRVDYMSWNAAPLAAPTGAVPEPMTPALFAVALAGIMLLRRRKA